MSKIRVMIVEDAVVVRRLVADVLGADPEIEVIGTASNGRMALAKLPLLKPDLVTLDIEMPELDGLQTLKELRPAYPRLPVIMFSTLTQRGAAATLDALALGANDYVTKPANVGSIGEGMQRIREELIPRIKALVGRGPAQLSRAARPPVSPPRPRPAHGGQRVELVVIASSTGGPNALAEVLPALPADFPVPVLVVQHMPPVFTGLLAERLNAKSRVAVREATSGARLEPGTVTVAPGDYHLSITGVGSGQRLRLEKGPLENSCRPAADVLFRSAAASCGGGVLGVVLTGMGRDGCRGSEAICQAGGRIIAQDENSSVVWGMPGFVAQAGLADGLYPLSDIAAEIVSRTRRGSVMLRPAPVALGGKLR